MEKHLAAAVLLLLLSGCVSNSATVREPGGIFPIDTKFPGIVVTFCDDYASRGCSQEDWVDREEDEMGNEIERPNSYQCAGDINRYLAATSSEICEITILEISDKNFFYVEKFINEFSSGAPHTPGWTHRIGKKTKFFDEEKEWDFDPYAQPNEGDLVSAFLREHYLAKTVGDLFVSYCWRETKSGGKTTVNYTLEEDKFSILIEFLNDKYECRSHGIGGWCTAVVVVNGFQRFNEEYRSEEYSIKIDLYEYDCMGALDLNSFGKQFEGQYLIDKT